MMMKEYVKVMKALAEPVRVKIIKMLEVRELCVCEIQTALDIPQPTVSKHLKVLEEAGLVTGRRDGLWINYHLVSNPESIYAARMLENLQDWFGNHSEIRPLLKKLPGINREQVCAKK